MKAKTKRQGERKIRISSRSRMSFRPRLEALEDRTVPSVVNSWNALSSSDHNWNTGSNWSLGHTPKAGEIATFDLTSVENCTINSGVSVNQCDGINIAATYTGTITENADLTLLTGAGFLQAAGTFNLNSSTIHDAGNWTRSGPSPGTFDAGSGTIDFNAASGTQTLDNGATSLFNVLHSGAGTLQLMSNALSVAGILTATAGTLDTLGQNVTVTGFTTISGDNSSLTNSGAADTLTLNGGLSMTGGKLESGLGTTFLVGDVTAISATASPALIGGMLNLGSSPHTFTVNHGPQTIDLTISATIAATPGSIGKRGAGVLALTTANNYTGGTTINAGTLLVTANGALGPGTPETTTVNAAGTLTFSGMVNYTTPEPVTLNGGTLASDSGSSSIIDTFSGPINILASGSAIQANGNTLQLSGSAITMGGFQLTVKGTGQTVIDDMLSGLAAASLQKLQSGTLTLNAANTYGGSGGTQLAGGTLAIGNDNAIGTGLLTTQDGTTLLASGGTHSLANKVSLIGAATIGGVNSLALNGIVSGAGSLVQTDIATLNLDGANTFSGGIMLNAGDLAVGTDTAAGSGTITVNNSAILLPINAPPAIANAVTLVSGATLTIAGTFDLTLNGVVGGPGSMAHTSPNILTLNGANTFGGGIIMNTGMLEVGSDTALGTGLLMLDDGTFIQAVGGAHRLSNVATFNNRVTITGSNDLTLTGVISSSGATQQLTKVGTGIATLSGNNGALNDTILVNAGALFVDGQQPNTPINVTLGATFGGTGTVGAIMVTSADLRPGTPTGPGILSSSNVSFSGGSTFSVQISGPVAGNGYSQLNVAGTVSLGTSNVALSLVGAFVPQPGNTFRIIKGNATPVSGTFTGHADGSPVPFNGVTTTIHYNAGGSNDVTLTVPPAKSSIVGRVGSSGQWWMAASTGTTFINSLWDTWSASVTWVDVQTGDFNGDGHADIAGRVKETGQWWVGISNGSSGFTTKLWTTWSTAVTWVDVKVGDFDGDGKADIVGRVLETGQWWVAKSTGSSFTNSLWATWSTAATWVDVKVGDFTADGKSDITGRWLQGGQWWTGVSTGSVFNSSLWATWSTAVTWVDVNVGDFDGNGKADIIGRVLETGQWWTGLSTGSSFATSLWTTWSPTVTWVDVKVGDFTGDGMMDLVGRVKESGQWWVALSNGSSFSNSLWATWSANVTWVDVQVGDFSGDGKADITGRVLENGQWWTGVSNGSLFNTSQWVAWSPAANWVDVQSGRYL
jgi:autotransporter-associated beta strand protein